MVRRYVLENGIHNILSFCCFYPCGGHFGDHRIAAKALQSGFFWPTLFCDAHRFCLACECYQYAAALSHRDVMPSSPIMIVEIFNVWDIDFMGPFPYVLACIHVTAVDCVKVDGSSGY